MGPTLPPTQQKDNPPPGLGSYIQGQIPKIYECPSPVLRSSAMPAPSALVKVGLLNIPSPSIYLSTHLSTGLPTMHRPIYHVSAYLPIPLWLSPELILTGSTAEQPIISQHLAQYPPPIIHFLATQTQHPRQTKPYNPNPNISMYDFPQLQH